MNRLWVIVLVAALPVGIFMLARAAAAAEPIRIDLTQWSPPDIAAVADDPFGRLVKYGYALFTNTANQIGPAVADPGMRFAGNNLSCQNCHLQAGTRPMRCR